MQWFKNRIDANILIEKLRRQYDEIRPHSSLGPLTPWEFKRQLTAITADRAISQGEIGPQKAGRSLVGVLQ
jgi:putative transposase